MNVEDAKTLFKEKYSAPWLELVDEHQDELFYKTRFDQMFRVSGDELRAYAAFEDRRSEFSASPVECCMCSKDYREQMISPANRFTAPYLGFRGTPGFGPVSTDTYERSHNGPKECPCPSEEDSVSSSSAKRLN